MALAADLVAQVTAELLVAQQVGTAKQERTPARRTQHNGYPAGAGRFGPGRTRSASQSCVRAGSSLLPCAVPACRGARGGRHRRSVLKSVVVDHGSAQ